jgi:MSHA pilin protein MshC
MYGSENRVVHRTGSSPRNTRLVAADSRGLTLVEIIMVIVLISIISVSIMPKFISTSSFSLVGGAAMIVADIRYTQELAMSSHENKKIRFTQSSSTYTLRNSDDSVFRTVELPSRVTVSSSDFTFEFNSLGEPVNGGGSVTIEAGGNPKSITVESYTGMVSSS